LINLKSKIILSYHQDHKYFKCLAFPIIEQVLRVKIIKLIMLKTISMVNIHRDLLNKCLSIMRRLWWITIKDSHMHWITDHCNKSYCNNNRFNNSKLWYSNSSISSHYNKDKIQIINNNISNYLFSKFIKKIIFNSSNQCFFHHKIEMHFKRFKI